MQFIPYLKVLTLIHAALFIGLLAFSAAAYFTNPDFKTGIDSNDIFVYLVPIVAALGYFGSTFLFQKFIRSISSGDTVQNKLNKFQTASIIKYAIIEGATIVALVGYYLQNNAMHLVIALCMIIYFYFQRPTKKHILENLNLTLEEQKQLQQEG